MGFNASTQATCHIRDAHPHGTKAIGHEVAGPCCSDHRRQPASPCTAYTESVLCPMHNVELTLVGQIQDNSGRAQALEKYKHILLHKHVLLHRPLGSKPVQASHRQTCQCCACCSIAALISDLWQCWCTEVGGHVHPHSKWLSTRTNGGCSCDLVKRSEHSSVPTHKATVSTLIGHPQRPANPSVITLTQRAGYQTVYGHG